MAAVTTQLYRTGQSAVTVRDPDGETYLSYVVRVQGEERALDGTLRQQVVATKRRWELTWTGLTSGEYATILGELQRTAPMTFSPPDEAGTYPVAIIGNPELRSDGFTYGAHCVLEEV